MAYLIGRGMFVCASSGLRGVVGAFDLVRYGALRMGERNCATDVECLTGLRPGNEAVEAVLRPVEGFRQV